MFKLTEKNASIRPIKSKLKISVLDEHEIKSINQTALDILEEVGIEMPSERRSRSLPTPGPTWILTRNW